jgi:hypothetical protein
MERAWYPSRNLQFLLPTRAPSRTEPVDIPLCCEYTSLYILFAKEQHKLHQGPYPSPSLTPEARHVSTRQWICCWRGQQVCRAQYEKMPRGE